MTAKKTVHRVKGAFKTGYSGVPDRPYFFEVKVEGQSDPIRFLLTPAQGADLDMGLFLLRPHVSGRAPDGTPITDPDDVVPTRGQR